MQFNHLETYNSLMRPIYLTNTQICFLKSQGLHTHYTLYICLQLLRNPNNKFHLTIRPTGIRKFLGKCDAQFHISILVTVEERLSDIRLQIAYQNTYSATVLMFVFFMSLSRGCCQDMILYTNVNVVFQFICTLYTYSKVAIRIFIIHDSASHGGTKRCVTHIKS